MFRQVADHAAVIDRSRAVGDFVTIARRLMIARGDFMEARTAAEADPRTTGRVSTILRAAISAGTTSNMSELADYQQLVGAFSDSLAAFSAFDRIRADAVQAPLRMNLVAVTGAAQAYVVGEGAPKPLTRLSMVSAQLDALKVVAAVVVSAELLRNGGANADALLRRELSSAVAFASDAQFIAILEDAAGLGASPTTTLTATGTTADAVIADIGALLAALSLGARSRPYLIVPPARALTWSLMKGGDEGLFFEGLNWNGGAVLGAPVIPSDGLASDVVVAVDASQLAMAAGDIDIGAARQADIEMESAPDSPPDAGTIRLNLWQTNMSALKAERYIGTQVLRPGAVQVLEY